MRDSIGFVFCRHYTKAAESRFHIFTLTLSLRERERNARIAQRHAEGWGLFSAERKVHPLPKGEGWGEGKNPLHRAA